MVTDEIKAEELVTGGTVTKVTEQKQRRNRKGIVTRKGSGVETKGLVTRIETGLANILETKLGSRGVGRVRIMGIVSCRRGKRQKDTTEKDRDTKTDEVIDKRKEMVGSQSPESQ